jgi:tRNA (guanine-N7-)-methyltransferase
MKKASELRIPFTWAERHPVLLERCLYIPGHYDKHDRWERVAWSDPRLFGNDQPVVIEYCSGNGEWISRRAKQNPHLNWVAVEKRFDRSRKIWARQQRESIANLFVICGDAVDFTRHYIPLQSVSEIFVNFPDPWPKRRHAEHRLIRKAFLDEVEKVMIPSGKAILVTDDLPYATQMLDAAAHQSRWRPLFPAPHYATEWPDYGTSFFCDLWREKGREIYFLHYEVAP